MAMQDYREPCIGFCTARFAALQTSAAAPTAAESPLLRDLEHAALAFRGVFPLQEAFRNPVVFYEARW